MAALNAEREARERERAEERRRLSLAATLQSEVAVPAGTLRPHTLVA
jgi:hypothetical protein